jgi:hypothetical protein
MAATGEPRYSFTQPVCDVCWITDYPDKEPMRLREAEPEQCCKCGEPTRSGIYIRVDPAKVAFPTNTK